MIALKCNGKAIDEFKALALSRKKDIDLKVREELILHLLPLVKMVLHGTFKMRTDTHYRDDCELEGRLALIHAVDHFDPKRSVYIITYVRKIIIRWVREAIEARSSMHLAHADINSLIKIKKEVLAYRDKHGQFPLAADMTTTIKEARQLRPRLEFVLCGLSGQPYRDFGAEYDDRTGQPPTQYDVVMERELLTHINLFGIALGPKKEEVFKNVFRPNEIKVTLEELGTKYGLSRASMSLIKIEVMNRFKDYLADRGVFCNG